MRASTVNGYFQWHIHRVAVHPLFWGQIGIWKFFVVDGGKLEYPTNTLRTWTWEHKSASLPCSSLSTFFKLLNHDRNKKGESGICDISSTGAVTCTDVDMHKIVSGSSDRTVKVRWCTPISLYVHHHAYSMHYVFKVAQFGFPCLLLIDILDRRVPPNIFQRYFCTFISFLIKQTTLNAETNQ